MTLNPHSTFFFSLNPHSLIMQPSYSLHDHILRPRRLEDLMIKDIPVVPPDSVIHTFSHLKGDKVDLVLTQDYENLSPGSFIIRQGDWAHYFLDAWFDPLYRAYNFQKAEGHALVLLLEFSVLPSPLTFPRNTLFSGIPQSSPNSPSYLNAPCTPTASITRRLTTRISSNR